jgi:hypothetical protein
VREIPIVRFEKGQRKDDIAQEHLARFEEPEGIYMIGVAQEKVRTLWTEKRRNPVTGARYPRIVAASAVVNQYYCYGLEVDFGPFLVTFSSYFPYRAKLCFNGHHWAQRERVRQRRADRVPGQLGVERDQLRLESGSAFAQFGGAGSEFAEGDELFLVAVDQASERVPSAGEVPPECVTACRGWVRGAEGLEPPVDLGLDQCRVVQQSEHAAPEELIDLWQPDRPVLAGAAFGAAVPVGARAAVVLAQEARSCCVSSSGSARSRILGR